MRGKLVRLCASALKRLRQLSASWQEAHRMPSSPACTSLWQAAQLVGTAARKSDDTWQDEQVVAACRPRSGNPVRSWSKVTFVQASVEWQTLQRVSPIPCTGACSETGSVPGCAERCPPAAGPAAG